MTQQKRAVVLLSGGLDSSTVAYIARSEGYELYCLSVSYGQRHVVELECAKKIAEAVGAKEHRFIELPLGHLKTSALTNHSLEVPVERTEQQMIRTIPNTYVPGRNNTFLAFATSMAEDIGAEAIFCGLNAQDYSNYPDCRPEFVEAYNNLLKFANKVGVEGNPIVVYAPLMYDRKEEIVKRGKKLGVPYELTWSCYSPVSVEGTTTRDRNRFNGSYKPCGVCDSCTLRRKGFRELGIEDPALKVS